jgi:hypothetical protein
LNTCKVNSTGLEAGIILAFDIWGGEAIGGILKYKERPEGSSPLY